MPVRVLVQLNAPQLGVHWGKAYEACVQGGGCLVKAGAGLADYWCSNACLHGTYQLTRDMCSYAENNIFTRCDKQEAAYLAWVDHWGERLTGNPLAVPDSDHSSILNLQRQLTVTH
jgi:hypothetical protein